MDGITIKREKIRYKSYRNRLKNYKKFFWEFRDVVSFRKLFIREKYDVIQFR